MGCVITKEVKSSSKRTPWGVHRALTIQVDRSIKMSGGGYVSAIFSANCGIVGNPGPVKASGKCESLPKSSGKGSYSEYKVSMAPERTSKHLSKKSLEDTVIGIPILSTDQESRLRAAQKSTESTDENLDTVNILELMEGLAEAEVSANYEQWNANHVPLMPSTEVVDRQGFPPDKPTDAQRASLCKPTARRPRPKSFSSFKSIEDVDLVLSARKSKSPPPIKSSSKAWPVNNEHGKMSTEENFRSADTSLQNGTSLRDLNVDIDRVTCETNSNAADTKVSCVDGKPLRNTDNLQRTLSFKYMFNDNSSKKQDFLNADLNPEVSQIDDDRNARVHGKDDISLATARLWGEVEGASAPFSPAVSLKDWLPSSNPPSNCPGYLKGGLEPSILDVFQTFQTCTSGQGAPHNSDSMKAQCMYPPLSQSASVQYQVATTDSSIEEDGVPVFDPEMLDSFENAMKNLSKEDWDAVRGMEESPRNFLRLVKELKKSSSNSMCNQKAFSKDQLELAEPLDMKLKRLSVEKELAFMRQNSLEVKKALAKASIKSDHERARVIFYSSTTQTNAKMYEDCNQVRDILQSLVGVSYDERSISEILEHEQELSHALNVSAVIVPTIYVKGKYLVGVDSIMQLYKKGLLGSMLQEAVPFGSKTGMQCICRGGKFLICPFCKGRRKISRVGEETLLCRYCSGAGLIKCLNCSPT